MTIAKEEKETNKKKTIKTGIKNQNTKKKLTSTFSTSK